MALRIARFGPGWGRFRSIGPAANVEPIEAPARAPDLAPSPLGPSPANGRRDAAPLGLLRGEEDRLDYSSDAWLEDEGKLRDDAVIVGTVLAVRAAYAPSASEPDPLADPIVAEREAAIRGYYRRQAAALEQEIAALEATLAAVSHPLQAGALEGAPSPPEAEPPRENASAIPAHPGAERWRLGLLVVLSLGFALVLAWLWSPPPPVGTDTQPLPFVVALLGAAAILVLAVALYETEAVAAAPRPAPNAATDAHASTEDDPAALRDRPAWAQERWWQLLLLAAVAGWVAWVVSADVGHGLVTFLWVALGGAALGRLFRRLLDRWATTRHDAWRWALAHQRLQAWNARPTLVDQLTERRRQLAALEAKAESKVRLYRSEILFGFHQARLAHAADAAARGRTARGGTPSQEPPATNVPTV